MDLEKDTEFTMWLHDTLLQFSRDVHAVYIEEPWDLLNQKLKDTKILFVQKVRAAIMNTRNFDDTDPAIQDVYNEHPLLEWEFENNRSNSVTATDYKDLPKEDKAKYHLLFSNILNSITFNL